MIQSVPEAATSPNPSATPAGALAGDSRSPILLGVAGLAALALLAGISPWTLWPFVGCITLALAAVLLVQGRTAVGASVIGVSAGLIWVAAAWWRTGTLSFVDWLVPMASYTVLVLAFHHAITLREWAENARREAFAGMDEPKSVNPPEAIPTATDAARGLLRAFGLWHTDWADQDDPWPAFDCFLRNQLFERAGAKHVSCFRVMAGGRQLSHLDPSGQGSGDDIADPNLAVRPVGTRATDADGAVSGSVDMANRRRPTYRPARLDSDAGIEGQVMATGQAYVRGRTGPTADSTARSALDGSYVAWCFPVARNGETVGLVRVGCLPPHVALDSTWLELMANLIQVCWVRVYDVHELGIARRLDTVSGVLSRTDFLTMANHALGDAIESHEPLVLVVLAIEGMRRLDTHPQWLSRDQLARTAGAALNGRLRADDLVGRFSDDRFVVVLRRTDQALGTILTEDLRQRVLEALDPKDTPQAAHSDAKGALGVRCAVVGARWRKQTDHDTTAHLHNLVTTAFACLENARSTGEHIVVGDTDELGQ